MNQLLNAVQTLLSVLQSVERIFDKALGYFQRTFSALRWHQMLDVLPVVGQARIITIFPTIASLQTLDPGWRYLWMLQLISKPIDTSPSATEQLSVRSHGSRAVGQSLSDLTSLLPRQEITMGMVASFALQPQRPPERGLRTFALVIGIDKYWSHRKPRLEGAVNDARQMAILLQTTFRVPESHIRLLCDDDATRKHIIEGFERLIMNSNIHHGDAIIIYFAGHGSRVRAPEGWSAEGGMVEAILPVDEGPQDGALRVHGIPDRTIASLVHKLSKAKGHNITLIFDCCHSGGIARSDQPQPLCRSAPSAPLPPELDEDILATSLTPLIESTSRPYGFSSLLSRYVLLAACRPTELARETISATGSPCGVFSDALFRHLRVSRPETTYSELLHQVVRDLVHHSQNPICEGENKGLPLFTCRALGQFAGSFTLTRDGEGRYVVNASTIHGISPGSCFSILQFDISSASCQEIRVLVAHTVFIRSSILHATDGATFFVLPPACRAVVRSWGLTDPLLGVYVPSIPVAWRESSLDQPLRYRLTSVRTKSTLILRPVDGNQVAFERGYPVSQYTQEPLQPPVEFNQRTFQSTLNAMGDFHYHLERRNLPTPPSLDGKFSLRIHELEQGGTAGGDLFSNGMAVVTPGVVCRKLGTEKGGVRRVITSQPNQMSELLPPDRF